MSDQLVRAITKDGMVKAVAVSTRDLTERARQIHRTLPVATAALGRTLAAASMMGNALKEDGASLTLRIQGGGPLGILLAVSDNQGNVRGTVDNPAVDIPLRPDGKLDVGSAVGCCGTLTVIRDLHMKDPYVGSVGLLGGEIAEDLAAYFVESEQIPTACGLGVLVDRDQSVMSAGGYIIQLLPGAGADVIAKVEGGVMAAGSVTGLLSGNSSPEELLRQVLSDFELEDLTIFRQAEPQYRAFAGITGHQLYHWYQAHRYCGQCGSPTKPDGKERMLYCETCRSMEYPRICPAVIIGVTDGNRLLLSKYAGRTYKKYALLAGYTEIGETMEETVAREVMEEVGLKVKNIRYYKSQPWAFSDTILMGFYCDLDGSDEIRLDEEELALAEWFEREEIPVTPSRDSLTNEMIMRFKNGRI